LPDKARFTPLPRANFDALRKALKLQAGGSKPKQPEPSSEGART